MQTKRHILLRDKTSLIPGLLLSCRCGKSVPQAEYKEGLCIDCLATEKCAPYRAEIVRCYRKRLRYEKLGKPTSLKGTDDIAHRNRLRIIKVCQGLTSNAARLEELTNEQGRLAREAVSGSKILLPRR